jgi:hypothetical protein
MRVQLAQQAKEILGQRDLVMITERVDDVALLIGQMVTMGLYRHGRRPPESVDGNLYQGHAPYPEPPERAEH